MSTGVLCFRSYRGLWCAAGLALTAGCARSSPPPADPQQSGAELLSRVVENHAEGVYRSWLGVHLAAVELDLAVQEFVEGPSEQTLARAREAWVAGRALYGPTEVFRFQGGPIVQKTFKTDCFSCPKTGLKNI